MHRVLSFQMGMAPPRGFGEPSEFVTKRMCFSFIFFISFLALLGGFLLGKFATERNMQIREKRREATITAGTATADVQQIFNSLLDGSSTPSQTPETSRNETTNDDGFIDLKTVKNVLSSLRSFNDVVEKRSSIVANLHGSHEPDRRVVLSLSGDGTRLGLELAKTFDKMRSNHNWKPQRTVVFCFFVDPRDSCGDNLSEYSKSRIIAYLAVHGKAVQRNGCFIASGSEIARSVVLKEFVKVREASSDFRRVIDDRCKSDEEFGQVLRLTSDIPNAFVSFKSNNSASTELPNEAEGRILTRIIGLSVLKFSDSSMIQWEPRDFEQDVKTSLKMINSSYWNSVKDEISSTIEELVGSFNERMSDVAKLSPLDIRMMNDLLVHLDKALSCPDANFRSIPSLLTQYQERMSPFLSSMLRCYRDAVEMLQEG